MLEWLSPGQVAYCDTDSVIFLCDHDNPNHKSPFSNPKDLPKVLSFGDALGQWSNELDEDDYITEFVCAGAKTYTYLTNKGKRSVRMKGITLDRQAKTYSPLKR